jgi:hypothetical protein
VPHPDFLRRLRELTSAIPDTTDVAVTHAATLAGYRKKLRALIEKLEAYDRALDHVKMPSRVFHPGRPEVVARMISLELDDAEPQPLSEVVPFYGSGVYCIYYTGEHPAYNLISRTRIPIYAGMASPKNQKAANPMEQGRALFTRLNDHRQSITDAERHETMTLQLNDFVCKHLVVESGWESAAESHLIRLYQPVWNKETRVCQGLGKHGDSHETRGNTRSAWDTLHPGRAWATHEGNVANPKTRDQLILDVRAHCLNAYEHSMLNEAFLPAQAAPTTE